MKNPLKRCEYAKDGKQCNGYKITNSRYCFTHSDDPKVVVMREEALKKAAESHKLYLPLSPAENGEVGMNLPQVVGLSNSRAIRKAFVAIIKAGAIGAISEKRLGALTFALNGYINALDKIDLLERVENLERLLEEKEEVFRWI